MGLAQPRGRLPVVVPTTEAVRRTRSTPCGRRAAAAASSPPTPLTQMLQERREKEVEISTMATAMVTTMTMLNSCKADRGVGTTTKTTSTVRHHRQLHIMANIMAKEGGTSGIFLLMSCGL